MNWNRSIIATLVIFHLISCKQADQKAEIVSDEYHSSHLIEADELASKIDAPNIRVIDFRKEESFAKGHLKNAIQLWRSDIEDTNAELKGMMASKEQMELLFSEIGITPNDTLVVYDDIGGCDAARFWWVVKSHGFESIRLLNGGLENWKANDGELTEEVEIFETTDFTFTENPSKDLLISHEELLAVMNRNEEMLIIDTRTADEYSGKRLKSGAAQAGRIPGSLRIDWAHCVNSSTHRLRSISELTEIYAQLQVSKDHPIVTYCHSGVRSAHTTFVLTELLGYTNVRNYDGSWTEWSHREETLIERDSITLMMN